ncbi:MAG: hypothetical protein J6W75_01945 [Bacteroidaceae bacterium]|nr:hypothetical protein [Bacteroidaceae bacterium]
MNNKKRIECLVATVDKMRKNSQEMRMWRNVPLGAECMELLQAIEDPEEEGIGKVMACEAIVEQLPEYDIPRQVLDIRHYEQQQLALASEDDLKQHPDLKDELEQAIRKLEDYIDTEHISDGEFRERYNRHLKSAPIERTPLWEENYYEVEKECDRRLGNTPRGMGFCFAYWSTLRQVLAERGILWQSPHELNPRVMFD